MRNSNSNCCYYWMTKNWILTKKTSLMRTNCYYYSKKKSLRTMTRMNWKSWTKKTNSNWKTKNWTNYCYCLMMRNSKSLTMMNCCC